MAIDRPLRTGLTLLLLSLAAYGIVSAPGLAERLGVSAGGIALLGAWSALVIWVLFTTLRKPKHWEWLIFAGFALALRVGSAALADGRSSPGDPHWYLVIAGNLLSGRGLTMFEPYMGSQTYALFPPAYALLLAGWGAVAGFSTASLTILSTLIDMAAAGVILLLANALDARRAGVAAACLYLIWPAQLLDAPLAQKESLASLFVLLLAYGWTVAEPKMRSHAIAIGACTALLALTQPGETLIGGLFALVQLPRLGLRRLLAIGLPALGAAALVMLPWWVRNYMIFGQFVPLTSTSGYSLWIGNNPNATGNWEEPPAALYGLPELAYGRAAAGLAWKWIEAHPADFAHITIAKFLRACAISDAGILRLAVMRPPISATIGALLFPLSYGAHLLMLGAGAMALQLRGNAAMRAISLMVAACMAQLILFGVWFEFGERHRAFLTPFVLLAIAQGVVVAHSRRSVTSARGAVSF
ncbi:MAG: glycosyltransferase [Candidatus Sphingomonas colombiensis]|nr:glycosyltransferase [Sphingomonas sp.]WEK42131.1 MAG: glycosyltransferase [Sphingomonas sp.]